MSAPTTSRMRIERVEASKHKRGRVLVFLEDGVCLKITEQELLDFGLRAGDELDTKTLDRLKEAAGVSNVKATAADLIGKREADARYAAEWLEAIGAINDADYAEALVRHYGEMGYGPARVRDKLYEKGVPRELWDDALDQLPDNGEQIDRFLEGKLRGRTPDDKEKKRLTDALLRRGYSWGDVKAAWSRQGSETWED